MIGWIGLHGQRIRGNLGAMRTTLESSGRTDAGTNYFMTPETSAAGLLAACERLQSDLDNALRPIIDEQLRTNLSCAGWELGSARLWLKYAKNREKELTINAPAHRPEAVKETTWQQDAAKVLNALAEYESARVKSVVSCRVCQTPTEPESLTHLKIYVAGSEGVEVCITCRQVLTEVLRGMMRTCITGKKQGYLAAKAANDPDQRPGEATQRIFSLIPR